LTRKGSLIQPKGNTRGYKTPNRIHPEKSDKTIALKGQINSTQWQRLGIANAPNQSCALKGQIKTIIPEITG